MSVCTLVDDRNPCGEAPIWDATQQCLYWTDCAGKFYRYDWNTRRRDIIMENFEITGCALDNSGGFTLINSGGVWFWNRNDEPSSIVSEIGGVKLQLNDCIADPEGRLLAGSCFYNAQAKYPLGKLFCVQTSGAVQILDEGIHLANGLGFSPDGRTLYFADSVARVIYAYEYDSITGRVQNRRVFVRVPGDSGLPDGLTVDKEGFIWSAEWYGGCLCRYDPEGNLERRIRIPAKQTSSLAFGGPQMSDIFVTSAAKSEPTPVMPPGYDPDSGYFGGGLFHLNAGISGMAEYRTKFRHLMNLRVSL
jgi:sugar lactone lactonase YvrE